MAYEPIFNIEGNLLNDPEMRFTPQGTAVASFRVGINDARPEANNNKSDVPSLVAEVSVWREMAENVAETLVKGMRITAKVRMVELGAYIPRKGGDPVGTLKVEALEIGPSLRWSTAKVAKVNRNGGGGQQGHGGGNQGNHGGQQNRQNAGNQGGGWPNSGGGNQADPWANGGQAGQTQNSPGPGQGNGWGNDETWGSDGGSGHGANDPWGQK